VFQPTVQVSYRGAFAGAFGNLDPSSETTASGNRAALNEADLFFGYGTEVGPVAATATYTFYTFPIPDAGSLTLSPTQEVSLLLEVAVPLAPSAYLVYDFDAPASNDLRGVYGELGVNPAVGVGGQEVTLSGRVAFDAGYLLPGSAPQVAHVTTSASTSFALGALSLDPLVAVQFSVAEPYRTTYARPVVFYGGLSIGF
jgi:hypothetical protein